MRFGKTDLVLYWKRLTVFIPNCNHARSHSLNRFEYREQLKETVIFRTLFEGQELIVTDLGSIVGIPLVVGLELISLSTQDYSNPQSWY